ncbi:MAG TPA: hypothetical protein VN444_00710 [Verrucomicrobiae bacterium]|nr:hypothetical protein [Verrucomicrobiae bacterium]
MKDMGTCSECGIAIGPGHRKQHVLAGYQLPQICNEMLYISEAGKETKAEWLEEGIVLKISDAVRTRTGYEANLKVKHRSEKKDVWRVSDRLNFHKSRARKVLADQIFEAFQGDNGTLTHDDIGQLLLWVEQYLESHYGGQGQKALDLPDEKDHLTPEEHEAAMALLKSPDLIDQFLAAVDTLGCVGEEVNKTYFLLAFTSRLLPEPIHSILKGEPSAGKNHLLFSVGKLFPEGEIKFLTGASAKALFYSGDDFRHKCLIFIEHVGGEESDYSIRTMQSEQKIVFWTVEKVDGRLETVEKVVEGPVGITQASTAAHLNAENETRCFTPNMDETDDQTRRILRSKATNYKLNGKRSHDDIIKQWQTAMGLLSQVKVVFPEWLDHVVESFPVKPVRVRRDFGRFVALIEASAVLHQHQREVTEFEEGVKIVTPSIEDYRLAYEIVDASSLLDIAVSGITPKCETLMAAIRAWDDARVQVGDNSFSVSDVAHLVDWTLNTVRKHLREAVHVGALELTTPGGKGRGHIARYKLLSASRVPGRFTMPISPDLLFPHTVIQKDT